MFFTYRTLKFVLFLTVPSRSTTHALHCSSCAYIRWWNKWYFKWICIWRCFWHVFWAIQHSPLRAEENDARGSVQAALAPSQQVSVGAVLLPASLPSTATGLGRAVRPTKAQRSSKGVRVYLHIFTKFDWLCPVCPPSTENFSHFFHPSLPSYTLGEPLNIQTVTFHFNFLKLINYSKRKPNQHNNTVPATLI